MRDKISKVGGKQMHHKKILFLIIFLLIVSIGVGCTPQLKELTAPPDDISLDEAIKINLKKLDIEKLSKTDISSLDGIELNEQDIGYELEYRYPEKPIKIKIVKFSSEEDITSFWNDWLAVHGLENLVKEPIVEFKLDNTYSVYAWQKGPWFTYIGVPNELLKDKVKDVIANHYLNLAKKETE